MDWKTTKVYKKGPKGNPGNYQPVSLTSVQCKIMESILKTRIMEHLLDNKLICPSQHGFMPGKSCALNLTVFLKKATRAVDEGKKIDFFLPGLRQSF
jgi:hypothetical protein